MRARQLSARQISLWRCPKCGHRFTSRNLSHSCGRYKLADHFRGRPPVLRAIFRRWCAIARSCGSVTIYAQKTRIVLQARVRFSGVVVHAGWLETHLWLKRRVEHPCLHRTEPLGVLGYAVHFRFSKVADIDGAIESLMREAYVDHAISPRVTARTALC